MKRKKIEQGYAVVWFFVVLALFCIVFGAMGFGEGSPEKNSQLLLIFYIGLPIAIIGLYIEAKRDLHALCIFLTAVCFVGLIITGTILLASQKFHLAVAATAIGMFFTMVASAAYIIRNQLGKDPLPNILREHYPRSNIFEIDGVQLAAHQSFTSIIPGRAFDIRFMVQNCWSNERKFTLKLKRGKRLFSKNDGLSFAGETTVSIPGGAVGQLTIKVLAKPYARGRYVIWAAPRIKGSGGTRVRKWRAQGVSPKIPAWMTMALAVVGYLLWGGGLKFPVTVYPPEKIGAHGVINIGTIDTNETQWEIIWSPEPHQLIDIG